MRLWTLKLNSRLALFSRLSIKLAGILLAGALFASSGFAYENIVVERFGSFIKDKYPTCSTFMHELGNNPYIYPPQSFRASAGWLSEFQSRVETYLPFVYEIFEKTANRSKRRYSKFNAASIRAMQEEDKNLPQERLFTFVFKDTSSGGKVVGYMSILDASPDYYNRDFLSLVESKFKSLNFRTGPLAGKTILQVMHLAKDPGSSLNIKQMGEVLAEHLRYFYDENQIVLLAHSDSIGTAYYRNKLVMGFHALFEPEDLIIEPEKGIHVDNEYVSYMSGPENVEKFLPHPPQAIAPPNAAQIFKEELARSGFHSADVTFKKTKFGEHPVIVIK